MINIFKGRKQVSLSKKREPAADGGIKVVGDQLGLAGQKQLSLVWFSSENDLG